jgi:hypothetical protein
MIRPLKNSTNAAFLVQGMKLHHSGKDCANILQSDILHCITAASAGEANRNTIRITPTTRATGPFRKLMKERTRLMKVNAKD